MMVVQFLAVEVSIQVYNCIYMCIHRHNIMVHRIIHYDIILQMIVITVWPM